MKNNSTSRREFLQASGAAMSAAWLGLHWPQVAAAAAHAHAVATGAADDTLRLLTPEQARDVEAIAGQIVPGGATPGAREAGVVHFIDHVYAGPYRQRAAEFLAGLAAFQSESAGRHPGRGPFADLDAAAQLAYLRSVERTSFFNGMKFLTVLGLLFL